jgi:hypothetical protein
LGKSLVFQNVPGFSNPMAKEQPPQKRPANLSLDQMKATLPKLERRIADLEAFDITSVRQRGDSGIDALHKKVNNTLQEILGADTIGYREYSWPSFDTLGLGLRNGFYIVPDRKALLYYEIMCYIKNKP